MQRFFMVRWEIGFIRNGLVGVFSESPEYIWLKNPYKDRYFADPFILDVDERYIYLLVEEMCYASCRGRIAKLVVDKSTWTIVDMKIVLEEPTHLSFPAIIRQNGHIYVYPENGQSGKLKLYELIDDRLVYISDICSENLADAVITDQFGDIKMFATKYPDYNGDTLHIYSMSRNTLKIDVHKPIKSIQFSDKHARMAGDIFSYNNHIYRPSQDCNINYGGGVIIEEVTMSNAIPNKFQYSFVKELRTNHPTLRLGIHTLNIYNGLAVVDVHGFPYWIGRMVYKMAQIKKHIKKIFKRENK
ncbi:MAG: hypothetical protein MJZ79_00040 [Paludibacteraceae bacterium]|nr:hypothetical protein [Paludibacteraceae bacterium]